MTTGIEGPALFHILGTPVVVERTVLANVLALGLGAVAIAAALDRIR